MNELIKILSKYNLDEAYVIEGNDRQFLAIKYLFENLESKNYFFPLIIVNSLIGYQLSWSWEEYWEEFSIFACKYKFFSNFSFEEIYEFFKEFLPQSKCNKRLLNMKIPRIAKMNSLFEEFHSKEHFYYDNISDLQNLLTKNLKQNKEAKTILFALKMFHYWARIMYWYNSQIPFEIWIPIDSRLTKIYNKYADKKISQQDFWREISYKINIPRIHLDAILWVKCNEFVCL